MPLHGEGPRFETVTRYQTCGCAAEWLGPGLQIRSMQVRVLSPTPKYILAV